MRFRLRFVVLALLVGVAAACSSAAIPIDDVPPLPEITAADAVTLLTDSDRPVVLNVWASWCGPCRSEAPLLRQAAAEWGDRVRFVGVDVRDTQDGARAFIAEFGLDGLDHFFDAAGAVPAGLGAGGVPLTFFFDAGGELLHLHRGVIDEGALALQVDELIRRSG